MLDFKQRARKALERAVSLLSQEDTPSLRYAALELRMALEALTYQRAEAFTADLPPEEYATWQPTRLLQALLEIDPAADQSATLFVGIEEVEGQPARKMDFVGTENVLSLKTIKVHYDALGSFLHMPTRMQLEKSVDGKIDRLRQRCIELVPLIEKALTGNMQSMRLGFPVDFSCQRCGKSISRLMPPGDVKRRTKCFHCSAGYSLDRNMASGETIIQGLQLNAKCANCHVSHGIWEDDLEPGYEWTCSACGSKCKVSLCVVPAQSG